MSKKIIIAAIGIAVLGAASAVIGYFASHPAVADETSYVYPDPKVGKYYLENGTEDEYIQVYDDGTIQVFGYEHFDIIWEINKDTLALMNDEEYAEAERITLEDDAFWKARHYYVVDRDIGLICFSETKPEPGDLPQYGQCLTFDGEDTIKINDERIYHYFDDSAENDLTVANTEEV